MKKDNSLFAFFALVRAGLWEDVKTNGDSITENCSPFSFSITQNWQAVYRLSTEQSVVGLIAAGFEQSKDIKVPPAVALQFVSSTLRLEQRNIAMNEFVARLIEQLRSEGIYTLLVKGQGIAQCYNRPLWRACGDIDLFLDETNYQKAKIFLTHLATFLEEEIVKSLHYSIYIEDWPVELHGTLHSGLWKKLDKGLDATQAEVFSERKVRTWMDGETPVILPAVDEDIVFVFSHIIQHFFRGGIGLRQICDWCRLLWTYRADVNIDILATRLNEMDAMAEWKAFAALAINTLGMPADAMPLYSPDRRWARKADKILAVVLKTGNFGHNRDVSYIKKKTYIIRKTISLWFHIQESLRHFVIFPKHTIIAWWIMIKVGITAVARGK